MPHDFRKPTPLPVDWHDRLTSWSLVALGLANKAWAKSALGAGAPLEASLLKVDLRYAGQTLATVSDDRLVYRITLGERVVSSFVLPRVLMLNLVGLLLGDNGVATDRELTLIEEKLGEYFLTNLWLAFFRESWPGASGVAWVLDGREVNLSCNRTYAETDVLLAMNWEMRCVWGVMAGVWYFPKKGLLDLWGGLADSKTIPETQIVVRREAIVQNLCVNVEVVLGSAEMQLSELSSLQVGDFVLLDQRATDGVLVRAGAQDLFHGQAGRLGSWKAFQITTNVKK